MLAQLRMECLGLYWSGQLIIESLHVIVLVQCKVDRTKLNKVFTKFHVGP
jgi:hypothetical protein